MEKVCPQQDSSTNFGAGLVQPAVTCCPLQAEVAKRRCPLDNAPCLHEEMPLCTFRPIQRACRVAGCRTLGLSWGYPTHKLSSDLPLLSPPPKSLRTSLARRTQLKKHALCLNRRRIWHKAPAQNVLMNSGNCQYLLPWSFQSVPSLNGAEKYREHVLWLAKPGQTAADCRSLYQGCPGGLSRETERSICINYLSS